MSNLVEFALLVRDNVSPALNTIGARIRQFAGETDQAQAGVSKLSGGFGKLAGLAAGAFAGVQALEFGKQLISAGADMEQTRVRFETFTGSAEAATEQIDALSQLATRAPFSRKELLDYGLALRGAGLDAAETTKKVETLANISSATGKDLGELTSLYIKNKGNGIIQGEDLNQLADAKIPLQDFAKQLGTNVQGLRKLGSQGKLTFQDLDRYFESLGGAQGKWGQMNNKLAATLGGRWSNFQDTIEQMTSDFSESRIPFFTSVLDQMTEVVSWIAANKQKFADLFEPLQHALQPLFEDFTRLREEFGLSGSTADNLRAMVAGVQQVMDRLEPTVTSITSKIGMLISTSVRLYNAFDKIFTFFNGESFGQNLLRQLNLLQEGFARISDSITGTLDGLATLVEGVSEGDFTKMAKGIKDTVVNGYSPIFSNEQKYQDIASDGLGGNMTNAEHRRQLEALGTPSPLRFPGRDPWAANGTSFDGQGYGLNVFGASALQQSITGMTGGSKAAKDAAAAGEGKKTKLDSKLGDVTGTKPTTINITIQRLTGVENQSVTTSKEALDGMRRLVTEELLGAVNDFSLLADR